jgi:hypothetical protein
VSQDSWPLGGNEVSGTSLIWNISNHISLFPLGCNTMWTYKEVSAFWRNMQGFSICLDKEEAQKFILNLGTMYFSKRLLSTCKSTWCYKPEDQHWHLQHHENLSSHRSAVDSIVAYFLDICFCVIFPFLLWSFELLLSSMCGGSLSFPDTWIILIIFYAVLLPWV